MPAKRDTARELVGIRVAKKPVYKAGTTKPNKWQKLLFSNHFQSFSYIFDLALPSFRRGAFLHHASHSRTLPKAPLPNTRNTSKWFIVTKAQTKVRIIFLDFQRKVICFPSSTTSFIHLTKGYPLFATNYSSNSELLCNRSHCGGLEVKLIRNAMQPRFPRP